MGYKHGDWYYQQKTLSGSFEKISFGTKLGNIKMKASNTCTFSWDGENTSGLIIAADNLVDFLGIAKSEIYVKGTGTIDLTGWEELG